MARTSRFTLALPGSRSAALRKEKKAEELHAHNGLPPPSVNSKVQQLLGTLDLPIERKLVNARSAPNRKLHKKGSLNTETVTDNDHQCAKEDHDTGVECERESLNTFSGGEAVGSGAGPLNSKDARTASHIIQPRPSSPVLREKYLQHRAPTFSDGASHQTHHSRSSSTLHSFYDAKKIPLAISQQTSASSARDMALRKGYPPITGPKDCSPPAQVAPKSADALGAPSKPSDPRLDKSYFFPTPRLPAEGELFPPYTAVHSPQQVSESSESPQSLEMIDAGLRPWRSLKKIISKESITGKSDRSCSPYLEPFSRKINVRKPSPGIKDWFDDIIEDEDLDDLAEIAGNENFNHKRDTIIPGVAVELEAKSYEPMHRCTLLCEQDQLRATREVSMSYRSSRTVSQFGGSSVCPTTVWSGDIDSTRSISSRTSGRSRKSRGSVFISSDLQEESVLALSSSEDEADVKTPILEDADVMIYNGRTLLKRTSTAPTEIISLRSSKTRISVNPHSTRASESMNSLSSSLPSRESPREEEGHTTPTMPSSQRLTKDASNQEAQNQLTRETPIEGLKRPPPPVRAETLRPRTSGAESNKRSSWLADSPPAPPSPTMSEGRGHQTRKSRIMAVTREEESLLEAMRQKRSTMQKHSFFEGYKTALNNVTITPTPPMKPMGINIPKRVPVPPPPTRATTEDALCLPKLNTEKFPTPPSRFNGKSYSTKHSSPLSSTKRDITPLATEPSCPSSTSSSSSPSDLLTTETPTFLPFQTPISPTLHISVKDLMPSFPTIAANSNKDQKTHQVRQQGASHRTRKSLWESMADDEDEDERDAEELAIWGLGEWSSTTGRESVCLVG